MAQNTSKIQVQETKYTASEQQSPDVEIRVLVDDCTFSAHRHILCSSSSVFQSLCSQPSPSAVTILIPDFSAEVVSSYLGYVYSSTPTDKSLASHNIKFLFQLHTFALRYAVTGLQSDIISVLRSYKVSKKNILEVVRVVEDNSSNEAACVALQQSMVRFMIENIKSAEDLAKEVTANLNSEGVLSIPIWKVLKDIKKTVRFSDFVQRQTFNTNSAPTPNTAKNKKKAAKKRKALERRISEVEASSVDESVLDSEDIVNTNMSVESFDDSSNDSGLASSLEESSNINFCDKMSENCLDDGDEDSPLKISNEYIFELDF